MAVTSFNEAGRGRLQVEARVRKIGVRIRELRRQRKLTLQDVAVATGLSVSMLSLVERGRTSPSIGTLVSVADALGVHMGDLFGPPEAAQTPPVVRRGEQPTFATSEGVTRRLLLSDEAIELAENTYQPGTSSGSRATHHSGHEYGIVLEGGLAVELEGRVHELAPGDAISFPSRADHRFSNPGDGVTRTIWLNVAPR